MLSISLADVITENDTCTPGSPNYDPNDPICAQFATSAPDTCQVDPTQAFCQQAIVAAANQQAQPAEISFEPTGTFRTACPAGYTLQSGVCIASTRAAGTSPMATSLANVPWKPALIVGGALGLAGLVYFIGKRLSERRK